MLVSREFSPRSRGPDSHIGVGVIIDKLRRSSHASSIVVLHLTFGYCSRAEHEHLSSSACGKFREGSGRSPIDHLACSNLSSGKVVAVNSSCPVASNILRAADNGALCIGLEFSRTTGKVHLDVVNKESSGDG